MAKKAKTVDLSKSEVDLDGDNEAQSDDEEKKFGATKSVMQGNKETVEVSKKLKNHEMLLRISFNQVIYQPDSPAVLQVEIKNDTTKTLKMIQMWMEICEVIKRKKKTFYKPTRLDCSFQEFYQGARFPLPAGLSYADKIVYPIPPLADLKKKINTSKKKEKAKYEFRLVVDIPYGRKLAEKHIRAYIPLKINAEKN